MAEQQNIEVAARCVKALSHPTRLKILATLQGGEKSVQEIERIVGTTQSNISQHLSVLRDKAILSYRKEGNQVFYMISNKKVIQLLELMQEIFCPSH